jgi:hypothetical protein
MNFRQWLLSEAPRTSDVRARYAPIPGQQGQFDYPVRNPFAATADKAIIGVATGIGSNFNKAMYPNGVGQPSQMASLGLDNLEEDDTSYFVTASMPIHTNERETVLMLKHDIKKKLNAFFEEKGVNPQLGHQINRTVNDGEKVTITMRFPKNEPALHRRDTKLQRIEKW